MTSSRSKRLVSLTLAMLLLVLLALWIHKPQIHDQHKQVSIPRANQPMLGNPKAKAHIVVFEDLKCTNCKIYNNTLFPKLKSAFIDTGKANYTIINLAFIPGSMPAANAARCLYAQNKAYFFPFVEYVFLNQPDETEDWATPSTLLQFAKTSVPKAQLESLSQCLIEGRYNRVILNNLKIASEAMDGKIATPALFVNGVAVQNLNFDSIAKLVKHPARDPHAQ